MTDFITGIITIFLGFFAIMNPIANTAVFAALVVGESKENQIKIALKALLISFFIILAFSLLGKAIFHLFGITLPALRISGGILVFLVGFHMLNGVSSKLHSLENDSEDSDISVSPLAVPILAGPGTIATAMNYSASGHIMGILSTVIVFAFLCFITFLCFISSSKILGILGKNGLNIVTRLMGLILTVIGVQMVIEGVSDVYTILIK